MKTVIIIQARMTSTRLLGKILMEVAGKPMLAQQIRRLKECAKADEIVIATTTNTADEPVVDLARQEGVSFFRGSEQDVLSRFVDASKSAGADVVVRVTGDCPLIDPQITDRVVGELINHSYECDYASNVIQRTFPRGLDVEAFFVDTLLRMNRLAESQLAREHVTIVVRSERPDLFLCRSVVDSNNNADLRWTVDTADDLRMIRILYEKLQLSTRPKTYPEILAYVRSHPELSQVNAKVKTWEPHRPTP
jgi:spore coat polysaccharide biosynthesis protein SpsF